jgi:hypothetical protein
MSLWAHFVLGSLAAGAALQLPVLPDTVCLRYRFQPGDTLFYRVEAQDSILIGQEPPLVRERYETLLLICDSIGADGSFWLRWIPSEFLARERLDTLKALRPESPCQQRSVTLHVDTLGNRLAVTSSSTAPVACPGGAFQLPFLVPLSPECVRIHASWLVQDSVELWENGFPPPRFVRTALLRAFPPLDTLGYRCSEVQHVTTGTGWFIRDSALSVRAVLNAFGRLLIAEQGFPVWGYTTQEIRLTLHLTGTQREGMHYVNVWYRLYDRRPARQTPPPSAPTHPVRPRRSR